ncbi:MAG: uroporphyrinogen decarboxylase family protein [Clostridia bacterium]
MRWSREQYIGLVHSKETSRQMFVELFGPLVGLDREWVAQGATEEEIGMTGFDWDYVPYVSCGGNADIHGGKAPVIIEETDEHVVSMDALGRRVKLRKGYASIPLPMDYPVKDMDDWLKVKPLYEYSPLRIDWDMVERAKEEQARGVLVVAAMPGGFDLPRQLMGEEELCYAYYEQQELLHDILETAGNTAMRVFEEVSDHVVIDQLSVHEDMAGKSGPLIGPALIDSFIKDYYLKIWKMLESKGSSIFSQDSDGYMNPVIQTFMDCGVNQMYPNEPGSGMDIVEVRKKYGNALSLKGGINKYVLKEGREAIRKELEYKMQPLMRQGGVVFGMDHRIPNGTPIENYRYYVALGREILGIEPLDGKRKGWMRQAF